MDGPCYALPGRSYGVHVPQTDALTEALQRHRKESRMARLYGTNDWRQAVDDDHGEQPFKEQNKRSSTLRGTSASMSLLLEQRTIQILPGNLSELVSKYAGESR